MQWAIVDGLGLISEDGLETCNHNFWSSTERVAPPHWYPQSYNFEWELSILHPRLILHASRAISVYCILPGEPLTRALQSGAECSTDRATAASFTWIWTAIIKRAVYKAISARGCVKESYISYNSYEWQFYFNTIIATYFNFVIIF